MNLFGMPNHDIQHVLQRVLRHCPHCQAQYRSEDILPLLREEDTAVSHVSCPSCHVAMLSVCVLSPIGTSAFGMATDLSAKEALRHLRRAPISEDDLLRWHEHIARERIV
jgi:hypothetical protein